MEAEKDEGNVYASNVEDKIIHISEARSGKKGYFCLGCSREMQAVKSKIENYRSYFRHDPKGVEPNRKCTYSDETHRHKLAKDILQQIEGKARSLSSEFAKHEELAREQFAQLENAERREIEKIQESGRDLPATFGREGEDLEARYRELRASTARTVESRDVSGGTELSRRVKRTLQSGSLLADFQQNLEHFKRNRKAWECFKSGAFKDWLR